MKRALAFTLMVFAIMIIAVSCEEPQAHVHTYSEKWECDENYHWHEATCEHTDEKGDKAKHTWGDWVVDEKATETEKGSKHRVCSVCERTETSDIAEKSHSHTYSTYQWSGSRHWRVCTSCGEELSSSTHSKTWNYDSDTHYQTCYCGWTTDKASHSFKTTTTDEKTVETCTSCGYSKTSAVTVTAEVKVDGKLSTDADAEKEETIKGESGENNKTVVVVPTKEIVTITTSASVANASDESSSSSSDSSSTESSSEDTGTIVSFPVGALKVITAEKNGDEETSVQPNVSLKIKAVTAIEATSSGSDFQGTKTTVDSGNSSKIVVATNEAVVAGFEFNLSGAISSGLKGTEEGSDTEVGTKITTYIAKGIEGTITVKYIGTTADGDQPKFESYDKGTGQLVFRVYHFSKYAVVAESVEATDNKGNMYKTLADAVKSNNINENGTITLLKDISLETPVETTRSLVIDLNGKTISATGTAFNVKKGTLTIKNGTVKSTQTSGYVISVESTSGNAGLILDDTATIGGENCSGIMSKGTSSYTATLNISGTITSSGTAIYQKSYGSLTINGEKGIKSTAGSAVEIGGGTATISRGTLTTTATYPTDVEEPVVGAAVAVAQNENGESISVSIYGGTFTADTGKQLAIVNPNNKNVDYTKNVKVYVGSNVAMTLDKIVGTKTGNSSGIDGTYYLDSKSALKAGVGKVASIGNENYASLEDAIIAAASGEEIVLAKDVKVSDAITLKKGITLNLAGNKLSFADGQNLIIQPDTPDDRKSIDVIIKNGSIDGGSGNCSVIKMCSYVNLTLDDVDMTANKVGNANALVFLAIGVDPAELVITNGSNLTMYGTYGVGTNAAENANVEITINGNSEIVAQANGGDSIGLFANVSAKISIENATISGEKVGVLLRGIGKEGDSTKKAAIKNSTISSTGTGAYEMYEESNWESGTGVPAAAIVVGSKNGNYHRSTTVEFGEKVTLTHASESAVDIYVYQENESYPVTVSGDIDPSWTNNTDMNEASYPEAKVGDQNYTTLQEAIEASGTNNTVEILKDVDLSKSMSGGSHCGIKIEKALTLNGNGHELYNNKDIDKGNCSLVQIGHDSGKLTAVITLKDVKIKNYGTVSYVKGDNAPYSGSRLIDIWEIENTSTNNENPDGAVYFNNVEIYSTNAGAGMYYRGISFWGNKNAVVSLMKSKVDIPSYYAIYLYNDEKVELKIEESTINGWAIIDNYGENDLVVTANKSVFNSTNIYDANGSTWNDFGAVKFEGNETNATENARMTCTDCTFNVTAKSTAKQYLANLSAQGTLELNNCTINPSGEAYGILSGGGTIKLTGCSVRQSDGTYQIITSDDYK